MPRSLLGWANINDYKGFAMPPLREGSGDARMRGKSSEGRYRVRDIDKHFHESKRGSA
jgi:hypothetical protein